MKVLTTTGLTELIQLSKDTFLDKNNTVEIDSVFAPVATSGAYNDLTGKPTVDQAYNASSTNAQSGTAVAGAISGKQNTITGAATTITSSDLTSSRALISNSSGKVAISDTTSTELGYVHGVTSAIQTQLDNKVDENAAITGATKCKITYDSKGLVTAGADLSASDIPDISATYQSKLVSGTNIKTVNNNSLLGSGNINIDSLPAQSGQSGKFLTTNGTSASWATVDALPSQSGNNGKFLTTNGSAASWASLPTVDQTYDGTSSNAQAGKAVKEAIDAAISAVYKPAGSVAFANRPTLSSSIEGNVYNITDAFTTTSDFVEGAGKSYPAGTNIVCINTATSGTAVYKWDVLTGMVDLSGYQTTITGGATTITDNNLTASRALISNSSGKVAVSDITSTELGYLDGVTSAIQTQLNNKVAANSAITGATKCKITYDSKGLVTAGADLSASDIPSITLSKISDVTASAAEVNILDGATLTTTELNYVDGVTSSIQTQLNNKQGTITGAATTITTNDLTASRALISDDDGKVAISDITATELGYLDGVTSNIQTQFSGKQGNITGAATTITDSNLTASRAVISDASGKVAVSTVTSTELGYVSGVTSSIQTQLNGKEPTVTGAASTITSSNLSINKALISNNSGKVDVSTVTSTELGYLSGVTSAVQTQLNGKQATISGGASTITDSNLTASRALMSNASGKVVVSDITATELGYLDDVTSNIQTQLNGKQATLTSANAGAGITISNQVISETYPLAWEQVAETSEIPQYNVHVYWGNVDGSLANQTDLYNALSARAFDNAVVHILGTETVTGTKNFTGSSTSNTPTASSSTATEYIATTGWVNNPELSLNVVHRSGDETIAGVKTFTEVIQGTAYDAYYADLAEYYKTDKDYPKGTLVQFGGTAEMTEATTEVNAVISSDPGFVLNKQADENYQPIALIGRVPVRIIGKVEKFDYIVLCDDIPGVARSTKDKNAKNIIGRALESSLLTREKLIECSIKLAM